MRDKESDRIRVKDRKRKTNVQSDRERQYMINEHNMTVRQRERVKDRVTERQRDRCTDKDIQRSSEGFRKIKR